MSALATSTDATVVSSHGECRWESVAEEMLFAGRFRDWLKCNNDASGTNGTHTLANGSCGAAPDVNSVTARASLHTSGGTVRDCCGSRPRSGNQEFRDEQVRHPGEPGDCLVRTREVEAQCHEQRQPKSQGDGSKGQRVTANHPFPVTLHTSDCNRPEGKQPGNDPERCETGKSEMRRESAIRVRGEQKRAPGAESCCRNQVCRTQRPVETKIAVSKPAPELKGADEQRDDSTSNMAQQSQGVCGVEFPVGFEIGSFALEKISARRQGHENCQQSHGNPANFRCRSIHRLHFGLVRTRKTRPGSTVLNKSTDARPIALLDKASSGTQPAFNECCNTRIL